MNRQHDLTQSLKRDRGSNINTLPLRATLVRESPIWNTWQTSLSKLDLPPGVVRMVSLGWSRGCAQIAHRVWAVAQGIESICRTPFIWPCLLGLASLLILSFTFNIALRSRFHTDSPGNTVVISQHSPSRLIRDLQEGRTAVLDELIHNLVPRRM